MNKYLWSFALSAVVLAGCGKKEEPPAPVAAPAPAASAPAAVAVNSEEKILNIYNWPDYVPEGMTTVLCLVIGYPFAYFIARSRASIRPILLMMVMLPFWTSFLLRVYAWKGILADQGVINRLLMGVG